VTAYSALRLPGSRYSAWVAINRGKLGCAFGIGDASRLPLALGMGLKAACAKPCTVERGGANGFLSPAR
jgi:hypothetical protein